MKKTIVLAAILAGTAGGTLAADIAHADTKRHPRISTHRGTWLTGPTENTDVAFRLAHKYSSVLETDLRETKDHRAVFMHDNAVDRTTRNHGWVSGMTYSQVRALRPNKGGKVASAADLARVLRNPRMYALVELKRERFSPALWADFNKSLRKYRSRVIFYSLSSNTVTRNIRLKYGYQGCYHPRPGADTPSRSQILRVGRYVWRSAGAYGHGLKGVRHITGPVNTKAKWRKSARYGQWAIVTDKARAAKINHW